MTANVDVTLTNGDNGKQFQFRAVAPFKNRKSQPASAIPLVDTKPTNTLLFRFIGQSEEVTFTFALFDDGADVSGTTLAGINTVSEQTKYLRDEIYTEGFDTDWTLDQPSHYDTAITGVITNLEFDSQAGAGTIRTGTLTFKRGRIVNF